MGWCNVFCFRILYLLLYIQMDKSLILWLFPLDGPSDKTIRTVELNPVKPCVFVCYSSRKIAKTIDFGWNWNLKKFIILIVLLLLVIVCSFTEANKFVFIFRKFPRKWANPIHPPYLKDYTNALSTCLYILECLVT